MAAEDQLHTLLRMVVEGSSANRAAFSHGRCRFTYARRTAADEASALATQWDDSGPHSQLSMNLFWERDSLSLRMDIPLAEIRSKLRRGDIVDSPMNIVKRGRFAIDHDGLSNTAIVHSPDRYRLNIRLHPFNLAYDSENFDLPASVIRAEALKFRGYTFEAIQNVERNGRKYLRVNVQAADSSHDYSYFVDPDKGFLPFLTESFHKQNHALFARMHLVSTHHEGGAWFPMHAILVIPRTDGPHGAYVDVRQMVVDDLDLAYVPTEDDLTITIPSQTQFSDGSDANTAKSLYRESKAETVSIPASEIENISRELKTVAADRRQEEASRSSPAAAEVTPRSSRSWTTLVVINVALLCVMLLAIAVVRRRMRP